MCHERYEDKRKEREREREKAKIAREKKKKTVGDKKVVLKRASI